MNSTAIAAFFTAAQSALEGAYPGTLTHGASSHAVSRGPWRNVTEYQQDGTGIEARECRVRIRKTLLTAASQVLKPGATTVTLDSVTALVTAVQTSANDTAFDITLRACAPSTAQA